MEAISRTKRAISSREYESRTRLVDPGLSASESPGRQARDGRIGRGANPPPQFGQTLRKTLSTQSAQNVHS
jgi:hypothetical protein